MKASKTTQPAAKSVNGAAKSADSAAASGAAAAEKETARVGRVAAQKAELGRRAAASLSRKATAKVARKAAGATTAVWAAMRARGTLAAGAGLGAAVAGACFAAGRRSAAHRFGPVTRMTGGRL